MVDSARALYAVLTLTPPATHAALGAFLYGYHALDTMERSAAAALEICRLCDAKLNGAQKAEGGYLAWHAANRARTKRLLTLLCVDRVHLEAVTVLFESVCTGLLCVDIFLAALRKP